MRTNLRVPVLAVMMAVSAAPLPAQEVGPVRDPATAGMTRRAERYPYAVTREQVLPPALFRSDSTGAGLAIDLGDTTLFGSLHSGPAFFDEEQTDFFETRYRQTADIVRGKGVLPVRPYFEPGSTLNANRWTDRGVLGYRMELLRNDRGRPVALGLLDGKIWFRVTSSGFRPVVSLVEGPDVNLVVSDHPDWMIVACETDRPSTATVEVKGGGRFTGAPHALRHEICVGGLLPSTSYRYRVLVADGADTAATPWLRFTSAPPRGKAGVTFVYAGDGRQASGGGEHGYRGVNRHVVSRIAEHACRGGAQFFLFGGDLIGGHVNNVEAFRTQLKSFKQAVESFRHGAPFFTAMGNHETLLHVFEDSSRYGLAMDRWPYDTESAEAVFAREFVHPENGPPARQGFPPYAESVFSFQYGDVRVIVFNNNYWWTSHHGIARFGGSPEGYVLPEQMEWIGRELRAADEDPTVRYVLLLAQEPVFPGGGHVKDAMWHGGNNRVRAHYREGDAILPFPEGIVDVRNRLWEMVCRTRKVAVVLGSDEHNYQRMLISNTTPVGVPALDDRDGDGKLEAENLSANAAFVRPTWFVISGGAGAPYYTQQPAPWGSAVVRFTPQTHYVLFKADAERIMLQTYSVSGQLLDEVKDLMSVRR